MQKEKLEGENVYDQIKIDKMLIEIDGTENKARWDIYW